ncbi:hypothetical protein FHR81_002648 [Actinoalloteichus hoggarensis]|nr:hypothetical protein [Actinoalloteichus hoggarensis]
MGTISPVLISVPLRHTSAIQSAYLTAGSAD